MAQTAAAPSIGNIPCGNATTAALSAFVYSDRSGANVSKASAFTAPTEAGNANCNGSVDIVDALLVAQCHVGIIDELCQERRQEDEGHKIIPRHNFQMLPLPRRRKRISSRNVLHTV
jgi:hypothetical protein